MSTLHTLLFQPFIDFGFMRRALVACFALALSGGPLGTLLVLRRMSLMGDAIAHALLPGAAAGFLYAGLSLWAMGLGGFIAALLVAALAGATARVSSQHEDGAFAAFYLIALAAGVMLISLRGNSVDLMRVLFGNILGMDDASLYLVATVTSFTLLILALVARPLLVESFDPGFLAVVQGRGGWHQQLFLALVVANLVTGFTALGALMAVGLMMLPPLAARFWVGRVGGIMLLASILAAASAYCGLLLSYYLALPSGPAIVLCAGMAYLVSVLAGTRDSLRLKLFPSHAHQTA